MKAIFSILVAVLASLAAVYFCGWWSFWYFGGCKHDLFTFNWWYLAAGPFVAMAGLAVSAFLVMVVCAIEDFFIDLFSGKGGEDAEN